MSESVSLLDSMASQKKREKSEKKEWDRAGKEKKIRLADIPVKCMLDKNAYGWISP